MANPKKKLARINPSTCDGSPLCPARRSCPQNAIAQGDGRGFFAWLGLSSGTARVTTGKCTGCGVCINNCPMKAISLITA